MNAIIPFPSWAPPSLEHKFELLAKQSTKFLQLFLASYEFSDSFVSRSQLIIDSINKIRVQHE